LIVERFTLHGRRRGTVESVVPAGPGPTQ
jgi:hypothetical protein